MSEEEAFDEVVYETRPPVEAPSRACDACRKMKIKCIDKEKPPCKRCKQMKIQCRFIMGPMPRQVLEETEATKTRLEELEGHVSGIYKKLDQMTDVLARLVPNTPTTAGAVSPAVPNDNRGPPLWTESYEGASMTPWSESSGPPSLGQRNPMFDQHHSFDPRHGTPHRPPPHHYPGPPPHQHQHQHQPPPHHLQDPALLHPQPHPHVHAPLSHERERLPARTRSSSPLSHDDMLEAAAEGEPFRHFTKQEEDAHILRDGGPVPPPARKRKRNHQAPPSEGDEWQDSPIRERGDLLAHDPITTGMIAEDEARQLFERFFKYSHPFVPVFDPAEDTFERLRKSPLCMTVILMVAVRHREAAGEPSTLSKQLKEQAEHMVKLTLFSPVATLETVQGLTVLVHYSEHAWRTCCHATALAVDMRLYRCLPYIHKIRSARHPNRLLERQRPLVAGARVWLALMRLSYEMSFNHSLPIQFNSPHGKRTQYARDLLDHPLSNLNDSRLVTACEMCELREIPFRPHESLASQDQAEVDRLVRMANRGIHELYDYWLAYYQRLGLPDDHFLRIELDNQKAYCIMYTNSPAWHGVNKKGDVQRLLSPERQKWVSEAMQSGAFLVSCLANKRLEKESEFGNHGYYVGIVATARYLIRMCELLPSACDLQDISLNIDKLLLKLPVFAAGPFADGLRRTLRKAREQGILPYTRMSDAAAALQPATAETAASRRASTVAEAQYPGFNPFPWHDPVQAFQVTPPTQSASHTGPSSNAGPGSNTGPSPIEAANLLPADAGAWPDDFNLAAWFPTGSGEEGNSVDISALDIDMANWFPAAPQVWQE